MRQQYREPVSIIMPVFNASSYLDHTFSSILNAMSSQDELVVADDGSSDNSLDIIARYSALDSRITYDSFPNQGIVPTLNYLLSLAKNNLIARMDADDICTHQRLDAQVAYLVANPQVAVCGTSAIGFKKSFPYLYPMLMQSSRAWLKAKLAIHKSPFIHPTVVFNRSVLGKDLFYSCIYPYAEDLELWLRLMSKGYLLHNIPKIGIFYRIHPSSVTKTYSSLQSESVANIFTYYSSTLLPEHPNDRHSHPSFSFISGFATSFEAILFAIKTYLDFILSLMDSLCELI